MQLLIICDYLMNAFTTRLVIFVITLQLVCDYFGFYFPCEQHLHEQLDFHQGRTTYVPLVANVTNLVIAL